MRAETRHQLKQDRFSKVTIEAAEKTAHWTVEHKSKVTVVAIAVLVVAALAVGGWFYLNTQDEKASADLSAATRTMDTPVRPVDMPPQPGYDTFASTAERATAAHKQFQAIADKYPHTRSATMAHYFLGLTAAELGDNAAAEKNLEDVAGSFNKDVAALGKFALASIYRADNKDEQAVDIYKKLADKPTLTVSKLTAQLELARFYEGRQKPDEAKRIYEEIKKENPATEAAALAQQRASELK